MIMSQRVTLEAVKESLLEQRFADITIEVESKKLQFHRIVLWGIPYFQSLFKGNWKESDAAHMQMHIDDPFVTVQSFEAVVGTMYCNPLELTQQNVEAIHATASFLQMEEICSQCVDFIVDNLSLENATGHALTACSYQYMGRDRILDACIEFFWLYAVDLRDKLFQLPSEFLCDLLTSDCLWMPSEFERFRLITDIFDEKMSLLEGGKNSVSSDAEENANEHRDTPRKKRRKTARQPLEYKSVAGGHCVDVDNIVNAYETVLCVALRYEHMGREEVRTVCTRINKLNIPAVRQACLDGIARADALRRVVKSAYHGPHSAILKCDLDDDDRWFRFGVEVSNARHLHPTGLWASSRVFFGGSQWWLEVRRSSWKQSFATGPAYGVHLCRKIGDFRKCTYSDRRQKLGVEVEFICGSKSKLTRCLDFRGMGLGFPAFVSESELDNYMTPQGALRFMVLLHLLFCTA